MSVYAYLLLSILCTVLSQIAQKYLALSSHGVTSRIPFYLKSPLFWLSILFLGLSMLSWLFVLEKMAVGKAYAMLSLNYVIMLWVAKLIFAEQVPKRLWLGTGIIIFGIYLVAQS